MKISETAVHLSQLAMVSDTPHLDREILLSYVLQKPRSFCIAHPEYECTPEEKFQYMAVLKRRLEYETIDTIVGEKEFFGISFVVNSSVLSPRGETEWIVEEALRLMVEYDFSTIIDVGTGSGCILLSLMSHIQKMNPRIFLNTVFIGSDISEKALEVAQKNANILHLQKNVTFVHTDLLQKISLQNPVKTLILANLPYIPKSDVLPREVLQNDPHLALFSNKNGTGHYQRLFEQIPPNIGGFLWEFHPPQKAVLQTLVHKKFFKHDIRFYADIHEHVRFGKILLSSLKKEIIEI